MDQVIYYSRSGNTKKLADAMGEALGVKPVEVANAKIDPAACVVFLGSGRYAGTPGQEMMKFIETNDFKGQKVALFGTYWLAGLNKGREIETTTKALEQKGAIVVGDYRCPGKFIVFNLGRPNARDLEGARGFAKKMKSIS
ncbi:MAG TPA: flavodoxin family protein [Methanocella sp.]|uniref:flavodoxin family protein n=1 Tax=Methanocella sp. TaxID=2052833 RepID=UPI002D03B70A|nr:flavodoxin family protein [Methanocella sp.]HTY89986.1 flavodoxin family protein [Methanocella sp.]